MQIKRDGNGNWVPGDKGESILKLLSDLKDKCHSSGFDDTAQVIGVSEINVRSGPADASTLSADLNHIRAALLSDFSERKFLRIDKDRVAFLEHDNLFGEAVSKKFSSAKDDIRQAGNCMAAECNTAAVFHLMRTVEWGLRALCVHLGFRKMRSKIKVSGKVVYTPIEYLEWDKMLNQLPDYVDKRTARTKKGPKKQEDQEFYYSILQDIRAIRDAWRNHVMHTRAYYGPKDAVAIMEHVKRIMNKLAERISEV